MEFHILGPPEVIASGRPVTLGGRRQRTVLAMLLANAHQVVSVAHLVDAAWEDGPPSTAKRQVQNSISALRRTLTGSGTSAQVMVADGPGYRIRVEPGQLDVEVFQGQVAEAQAQVARGHAAEAVELLRSALGLWRGPALAGISGWVFEAAAVRLEEQRLTATEQCLELELELGRHRELVGELGELVVANPLRERLVGQLMVALYRSGRQADALRAYHRLAARLADDLGLDPGAQLQELHTAILRNDPSLAAPRDPQVPAVAAARSSALVPAELPADVAAFTGRSVPLAELDALLPGNGGGSRASAVVISAIAGAAGVGKTALAVHWGHKVRDRFPDGQLYVNLRGYARPAGAADRGPGPVSTRAGGLG